MITVRDMVELATDDVFICKVYEINKGKDIFDGTLYEIPDEMLDCELCSWDIATEGTISFNVEMEN